MCPWTQATRFSPIPSRPSSGQRWRRRGWIWKIRWRRCSGRRASSPWIGWGCSQVSEWSIWAADRDGRRWSWPPGSGPGARLPGLISRPRCWPTDGREAARLGAGNVEFLHADTQVHDFGQARFDAAYSRFGVMFFTDPVAAFANVRQALRPGGTLSFVCWQSVLDNEWMLIPRTAVAEVTGAPAPVLRPGRAGPVFAVRSRPGPRRAGRGRIQLHRGHPARR